MFSGFPEETIRFFLDIRFHNEVSFYKAHEDEYQTFVKKPFYRFIEELGETMLSISDDLEVRPAKCLARLRRDTRFTKDKSPYRDHLWLVFHRAGEAKDTSVMYWFELSPETVEWGLGFWGMNRPAMNALRARMVEKPREVQQALRLSRIPSPELQILGERYQRLRGSCRGAVGTGNAVSLQGLVHQARKRSLQGLLSAGTAGHGTAGLSQAETHVSFAALRC